MKFIEYLIEAKKNTPPLLDDEKNDIERKVIWYIHDNVIPYHIVEHDGTVVAGWTLIDSRFKTKTRYTSANGLSKKLLDLLAVPNRSDKRVLEICANLVKNMKPHKILSHEHQAAPSKSFEASLTNENYIISYPDGYDDFVKEHFKDNPLLMNKWLRYAKNIREQS